MPDWKVENLRVTAFTASDAGEAPDQLWTAIVGSPPERIDQRPKEGKIALEGPYEGANLVFAREPQRIDLVWVVKFDPATEADEFFSIGVFESVSETFLSLARTWFSRSQQPVIRLAWGGVLVLPVDSKEGGYRKLAEFLPNLRIDPEGSSDLNYQINRARISRVVEGLRLNRLTTWSVAARQSFSAQLVVSPQTTVRSATGPKFSACRLQFDINSDPARMEPFGQHQLVPLLSEFVELSAEIADRGDIP